MMILAAIILAAWPQFGRDPAHSGTAPTTGQPVQHVLAQIRMDPFVDTERSLQGGDLLVHYAAPILDADNVFVEIKVGTYTAGDWSTQAWGVEDLRWVGSQLVPQWTAFSDWTPVPFTGGSVGPIFEPIFQPVLANNSIYMPGRGGSILRIDRDTGQTVARLGATEPLDAATFVAGPPVVDAAGNVLYNVIAFAPSTSNPWTTDVRDAWITRINPSGKATRAHYAGFVTGAPAATSQCLAAFVDAQLPWPPSADAAPSTILCGSQRPGINVAPAIAPDGTIYTASRAHFNSRWSYLVALNPDLTPKWTTSLRDRFNDGCAVLLPPNGTPGGCNSGARRGVDPSDNTAGAGRVTDDSSSSPAIAPDGSVFYGAYTRYNYSQGHMMHFSAAGDFLGAYPFGWDITPAIRAHDNTYSLITKENRYPLGSYCDDPNFCPDVRRPDDPQLFLVTQLDASLHPEWMFANPSGDEWCVNGPVVGADGVVYMNAEDGILYAINPDGSLRRALLISSGGGQAYTPLAMDDQGRVYLETGGALYVAGTPPRRRAVGK